MKRKIDTSDWSEVTILLHDHHLVRRTLSSKKEEKAFCKEYAKEKGIVCKVVKFKKGTNPMCA